MTSVTWDKYSKNVNSTGESYRVGVGKGISIGILGETGTPDHYVQTELIGTKSEKLCGMRRQDIHVYVL